MRRDTETKVATTLSPDAKDKLTALAEESGLTLAGYVRRIMILHLREKFGAERIQEQVGK